MRKEKVSHFFKNARDIAKKVEKIRFNSGYGDIRQPFTITSSVLYSKMHKYEHTSTLMKNLIRYFTRTFKKMIYDYIDSIKDIRNISK